MKEISLNSNKFAENQLKKFGWKEGKIDFFNFSSKKIKIKNFN